MITRLEQSGFEMGISAAPPGEEGEILMAAGRAVNVNANAVFTARIGTFANYCPASGMTIMARMPRFPSMAQAQ